MPPGGGDPQHRPGALESRLPGGTYWDGDKAEWELGQPGPHSPWHCASTQNRGTATEEGQGATLNHLRWFHTSTRRRDKTHKMKLSHRDEECHGSPTHLSTFHLSGGQMRRFLE